MNPNYPVYIVSKGRADSRSTSKAFEKLGIPYFIVVEEQEYDMYCAVIDKSKVLILPKKYKEEYDCCDELALSKSTGPGAARNFAWEHSLENGAKWHWVFDDNVSCFYRLNNNARLPVADGTMFYVMEQFVNRYENIAIAGLNYMKFAKSRDRLPPFITNTRIYSMLLIRNDIPYRWRGRYNEDTDLSLRALKDGFCTVQFNAFLGDKATTQTHKGGNTEEFYDKEGTENKSKMLEAMHPDVSEVTWKFNRIHHHVDYRRFKINELKLKPDVVIPDGVNNFGMRLINVTQ